MANRFFYIDDNRPSLNEAIIRNLNAIDGVKVESVEAKEWDQQIEFLLTENYDGLLIDWRLGDLVKYDSEALAQHIRTLVNNGTLKHDIPVLLCSANSKFQENYGRDDSSHNLFLTTYEKDVIANQAERVSTEMNSLAEAFKSVQKNDNVDVKSLLALRQEISIDLRLIEEVTALINNRIPHNFVRFILNEVVEKPGPLIDEDILAARLGIDLKRSPDWTRLQNEYLSTFSYNGILHEGWRRWWAEGFENWWKSQISTTNPKGRAAKQRVKLLIEKTGLTGLTFAEKQKFSFGTEYWTRCVITKLPLDPLDGLRVIPPTPQLPWQEEQFVSPHGLLEFGPEILKKNGFRLNPYDKYKWQNLTKNSGV